MRNHLANIITAIRIVGICVLFAFTPFFSQQVQCWVILFFAFLCLTDWVDGVVARSRFGRCTNLGKLLDPMADKLLVFTFLPLLEMGAITSCPVLIILIRDIVINTLRTLAAKKGIVLQARFSGKVKTFLQLPLIAVLLATVVVPGSQVSTIAGIFYPVIMFIQAIPDFWIDFSIWAVTFWTMWSGIEYLWANKHFLSMVIYTG
ncbi:MAG: hypothetical protein COU33_01145, partial [Candidatus Magasanikbacteria bacterium CG10_big_fil_rev_8_21_14_0_10_43_6]